jgi:Uncharacterized protein conserved in bacteria (DUF2255)
VRATRTIELKREQKCRLLPCDGRKTNCARSLRQTTCTLPHSAKTMRAYNGRNSRWYRAAMRQKAGRIIAAGMMKEVSFESVEGPINDHIDDAYRAKYQSSPYLRPMIGPRARSATVRVMPRDTAA